MLSPAGSHASLLPATGLPLTAFEEFMLADDRPSHPMVIVMRLDFTDGPPPSSLAEAFSATISEEPLLAAHVVRSRGRSRWMPAPSPPLFQAEDGSASADSTTLAPPLPRIDPKIGPMLHASVVTRQTGWSIVVAVHHAACDGLGIVGFMERWLLRATGKEARRPRGSAEAVTALGRRGRVAGSWREFSSMLPKLAKGLEGVKQFVSRDVVDLGHARPTAPETVEPAPLTLWQPTIIAMTLEESLVERLERRAMATEVMVNDMLMAALMTTLGEHVDGRAVPADEKAWIRLATPMSLRTKSDHALPAANRVSMVFLDRQPGDRLDAPQLVRSFKDEMDVIRGHSLGHIFPLSLAASRLMPGGLKRTTNSPTPQATAVLSNLGRCFHRSPLTDDAGTIRVGDSRLAGWWIVPPVRPGTALAAATHETSGRRTVAFHLDGSRVPLPVGRGWLDGMYATLEALAEGLRVPSRNAEPMVS
ncbi:MAG: hypothetical protein ACKOYJ_06915 [Planctomycetia bacterium]